MEKQKHILFLSSWYPNPDNISNGIFVKRHAQALALQHRVTLLFAKSINNISEEKQIENTEGNFSERLLFYPKLKNNIPFIGSYLKMRRYKKAYQKLIDDFLKERKPDIIHLNIIFPAGLAALYALKKCPNAKLFITEHWSGYYPEDGNYKGFFQKYIAQKTVKLARAVFVISDKLKQAMQAHGLKNNFHLINNVVDTNVFKPKNNLHEKQNVLNILHVSSLVEREKNISGIIEIAAKLKEKKFPFHLNIIGKNDDEISTHKKLAEQKKLSEHISFLGYKTPKEISEQMNVHDVFLLFSHFEGMPVVLLEAMACGLPVISSHVGQVQKMILPKMGIVLSENTINECVNALLNFNSQHFSDKENMHQYIAANYGMKAVGEAISNLYKQQS